MAVESLGLVAFAGLIGLLLAAFLLSLLLPDFVRAVLAFAAGSALLAAVFAALQAPFAAVLELTVGAGLTAVLFLVAITLTRGEEERAPEKGKTAAALLVVVLGGLLAFVLLGAVPPAGPAEESPWIGPWLWEVRALDMVGQALIVLVAVLGVLLLLREGKS